MDRLAEVAEQSITEFDEVAQNNLLNTVFLLQKLMETNFGLTAHNLMSFRQHDLQLSNLYKTGELGKINHL